MLGPGSRRRTRYAAAPLRSDSRGESDERSALRAPTPALRFSSPQKSPPAGTGCRERGVGDMRVGTCVEAIGR